MKKIPKIRNIRFREQNGLCHYCGQPMWHSEMPAFCSRYGVSTRMAKYFQATAEHLVPRSEGGSDTLQNIVAACSFCNSHRHHAKRPLSPEAYGKRVKAQLAKGRWHTFRATTLCVDSS